MVFVNKEPTKIEIKSDKQQEKCCHGNSCWQMLPKSKSQQVHLTRNIVLKLWNNVKCPQNYKTKKQEKCCHGMAMADIAKKTITWEKLYL